MGLARRFLVVTALCVSIPAIADAQASIAYRLSFPEPEHHWMQVDVWFDALPAGPLELHMSRASPGRYAIHEFAKNVYGLQVTDGRGAALSVSRVAPQRWIVNGHAGQVRVTYRIFGDRIDGTYLAIDATHAHINMPAALMWARGLEDRPSTVTFEPPRGATWVVATQLLPGTDRFTFTAPNLQYLMDSPVEFSAFALRTFAIQDGARKPMFRIAVHHQGSDEELDALARDVESIVREARNVFGEYPAFEGNAYTFIADYLPWANGDGMEHRNSTIVTSASSVRSDREGLLDTISHEFFHAWNIERIRPRSLEPFDFDEMNMSSELWLGEGFTSYYGPLVLQRARLTSVDQFARDMGGMIDAVMTRPGRLVRSVEEMSQHAPFVDGAVPLDRTNFDNTFISYYTWGGALGIGLDLMLRERSDGQVTLDHFMRALWERHGRPGGRLPGYVDSPYTKDDLKSALASVSGDRRFADDFFAKYVEGHEVIDYAPLLDKVGFVLKPVAKGQAFMGRIRFDEADGARVASSVPFGSPAYAAGLERDDVVVAIGEMKVARAADVATAIGRHRPGDNIRIVIERRGGRVVSMLSIGEDPRMELVTAESLGSQLTPTQRRLRGMWLSSPVTEHLLKSGER